MKRIGITLLALTVAGFGARCWAETGTGPRPADKGPSDKLLPQDLQDALKAYVPFLTARFGPTISASKEGAPVDGKLYIKFENESSIVEMPIRASKGEEGIEEDLIKMFTSPKWNLFIDPSGAAGNLKVYLSPAVGPKGGETNMKVATADPCQEDDASKQMEGDRVRIVNDESQKKFTICAKGKPALSFSTDRVKSAFIRKDGGKLSVFKNEGSCNYKKVEIQTDSDPPSSTYIPTEAENANCKKLDTLLKEHASAQPAGDAGGQAAKGGLPAATKVGDKLRRQIFAQALDQAGLNGIFDNQKGAFKEGTPPEKMAAYNELKQAIVKDGRNWTEKDGKFYLHFTVKGEQKKVEIPPTETPKGSAKARDVNAAASGAINALAAGNEYLAKLAGVGAAATDPAAGPIPQPKTGVGWLSSIAGPGTSIGGAQGCGSLTKGETKPQYDQRLNNFLADKSGKDLAAERKASAIHEKASAAAAAKCKQLRDGTDKTDPVAVKATEEECARLGKAADDAYTGSLTETYRQQNLVKSQVEAQKANEEKFITQNMVKQVLKLRDEDLGPAAKYVNWQGAPDEARKTFLASEYFKTNWLGDEKALPTDKKFQECRQGMGQGARMNPIADVNKCVGVGLSKFLADKALAIKTTAAAGAPAETEQQKLERLKKEAREAAEPSKKAP